MISVTSTLYGVEPNPSAVLAEKIINSFSTDNPLSSYPLQSSILSQIAEDNEYFENLIKTEPDLDAFSYYHKCPENVVCFAYKYVFRYFYNRPLIDVFIPGKRNHTLRYNTTLIYRVTNFKKLSSSPSELDLIYLDLFNAHQGLFLEEELPIALTLRPTWVGNTSKELESKSILRYLYMAGFTLPKVINSSCGYNYFNPLKAKEVEDLNIEPWKLTSINNCVTVKKLCWYGSSEEEVDLKNQFDLFDVTDTDSGLYSGNIVRYLTFHIPVYLKPLTQKEYEEVKPYLKCIKDLNNY